VLTYVKTHKLLSDNGALVHLIVPRPSFMHEGARVQVGGCMWVVGNVSPDLKGLSFGETCNTGDDDVEEV
jgi:hypothetical protein